MFRAIVTHTFAVQGRGTALALDIVDGEVQTGDTVQLEIGPGRALELPVRAVEFIDWDVIDDDERGQPAIVVDGISPSEVPEDAVVSS